MPTDKTQAQQKDGWQDKGGKLHQTEFGEESGLAPMTKFRLSDAANGDNDGNLGTEFGGKDAFEDF